MRAIVLGMMMLAATPAVAADQFDLVCKGQRKLGLHEKPYPVEVRYRVDIPAGAWCQDDCKAVSTIFSVEPGMITLDRSVETRSNPISTILTINRSSGQWLDVARISGASSSSYWEATGVCEPAEFSGFPAAKF